MDLKNDTRTQGLSLSTTDCQAGVFRPSCESTIYIKQGDLVLSPDMDTSKTTPDLYIEANKLAPSLNQIFQNVPFERLKFPSYSIGAAQKSTLESVQLELTDCMLDEWTRKLCKNWVHQTLHTIRLSILQHLLHLTNLFRRKFHS